MTFIIKRFQFKIGKINSKPPILGTIISFVLIGSTYLYLSFLPKNIWIIAGIITLQIFIFYLFVTYYSKYYQKELMKDSNAAKQSTNSDQYISDQNVDLNGN